MFPTYASKQNIYWASGDDKHKFMVAYKTIYDFFSSSQVEKMCNDLLDILRLCVLDPSNIQNTLITTINEETD